MWLIVYIKSVIWRYHCFCSHCGSSNYERTSMLPVRSLLCLLRVNHYKYLPKKCTLVNSVYWDNNKECTLRSVCGCVSWCSSGALYQISEVIVCWLVDCLQAGMTWPSFSVVAEIEYQLLGWAVKHGGHKCGTIPSSCCLGRSVAQADWLGPKVHRCPVCCLFYVRQIN